MSLTDERHLQLGEDRLFVCRWQGARKDAAPILLLHDSLGSVAGWRDFPAQLAERSGHSVVAWDRPGFGASSPRHTPLALDFIEDEARRLPQLLDALGLERPILLGYSVGGSIAITAAALHPARYHALITMAAIVHNNPHTRQGVAAARAHWRNPEGIARLSRWHGEKALWVMDAWFDTWLDPAFADWSLASWLAAVECPTLVIHGLRDEYAAADFPDILRRGLPAAQMCLLPESGHAPHRDANETVLRTIGAFLAPLSPSDSPIP